uniref:Uncharacterized protein n=1 Tax=Macrostomum lignano TaxID=282301 RepID=A0A1I8FHC4_9PLAT
MKISRRVAAQLLLIFIAQSALMYRETESMKLLQAGAAYKRFLYYSNGNCETFDIRCFSQRDCQMAYGPGHQHHSRFGQAPDQPDYWTGVVQIDDVANPTASGRELAEKSRFIPAPQILRMPNLCPLLGSGMPTRLMPENGTGRRLALLLRLVFLLLCPLRGTGANCWPKRFCCAGSARIPLTPPPPACRGGLRRVDKLDEGDWPNLMLLLLLLFKKCERQSDWRLPAANG